MRRFLIGIALVLAPALVHAETQYGLTVIVHNHLSSALIYKTQSVKPSRLSVPEKAVTPGWIGVLYSSRGSTTGLAGSVEWDARISKGPGKGSETLTVELHLDIGPNGNRASCDITSDVLKSVSCSASAEPKSCKDAPDQDCDVEIRVNVGRR